MSEAGASFEVSPPRTRDYRSNDLDPLIFLWMTEWKVDMDSQTDTHRHLSHLTGLYPGYSIASYDSSNAPSNGKLTKAQLLDAATISLIHRGNGTGRDADSGDGPRSLEAASFCLFFFFI